MSTKNTSYIITASLLDTKEGLLYFSNGQYIESLQDIENLILNDSHLSLVKGTIESQVGLYNDAILDLSHAIQLDPTNTTAYFERGACYFEMGDIDKSLKDYLVASPYRKRDILTKQEQIDFAKGFISGGCLGSKEGITELIPSIYASERGLSHGLWTFAIDPIHVSKKLIDASKSMISFIQDDGLSKTMQVVIPALQTTLDKWDQFDEKERGYHLGYIIGKYGLDVLAFKGGVKATKHFQNLRAANIALTLETIAQNEQKALTIQAFSNAHWEQTSTIIKNLKEQSSTRLGTKLSKAFKKPTTH